MSSTAARSSSVSSRWIIEDHCSSAGQRLRSGAAHPLGDQAFDGLDARLTQVMPVSPHHEYRAHWAPEVLSPGPLPSAPLGKETLKFPGGRASMALRRAPGETREKGCTGLGQSCSPGTREYSEPRGLAILSSMFRTQTYSAFHPLSGAGDPLAPGVSGCVIPDWGAGGPLRGCSLEVPALGPGHRHTILGRLNPYGYVVPEVLGLDKVRLVSDDCLLVY